MKNNIRIENITYKVDAQNKVVVCIIHCNLQLSKLPMLKYFAFDTIADRFPNVVWDGKFKVSAKARCSNSDEFNLVTGKRIAESRAKLKMFNIAYRMYKAMINEYNKAIAFLSEPMDICFKAMAKEYIHNQTLIKNENRNQ